MLSREQDQAFAGDGFVVAPGVAPPELIDAARREVQDRLRTQPPADDYRGAYSYFLREPLPDSLMALLFHTEAIVLAESLTAPLRIEPPDHVQIALTLPPWDHRPGGPHLDGLQPPESSGRPGTFTMLAGIFLTDQVTEGSGNLWVWPGSHRMNAAYLREHGADALLRSTPHPPIELPEPRQVRGRAGDLLLAHYLLGHNGGGNVSAITRETIYFRLRCEGHRNRWREAVQDPLLEFEPVRTALGE